MRPLSSLDSVRLTDFWRRELADRYPIAAEQVPFIAPVERFDVEGDGMPTVRLELPGAPTKHRYWFRSEDEENLVQIQNDWLAFNWRKPSPDADYRHYGHGEERLRDVYARFSGFCEREGIGEPEPVQAEITYINHVHAAEGLWSNHGELHAVLGGLRAPASKKLPLPESVAYQARFVARDDDDRPFGRLHVVAEPAVADGDTVIALRLTFRGPLVDRTQDGVMRMLDAGHHWIVGAFEELTTEAMLGVWGRKDRND